MENHFCQICNCPQEHRLLYTKNSFRILKCSRCTLVSADFPNNLNTGPLYDVGYFEGEKFDGYRSYNSAENILRSNFSRIAKQIFEQTGEGELIEIGSAYGYFLKEAQKYFHVCGFEISSVAAQIANKAGVLTHNIDFLQKNWEPTCAAAVVMLDCAEHLTEPRKTLKKIYETLRPDGLLLMTTGDIESLLSKIMGQRWRLMTPPQHLFYFSPKTITDLLASIGFKKIDINYQWKRVPLGLALYQLTRRLKIPLPLPSFTNQISIPLNLFDVMTVTAKK